MVEAGVHGAQVLPQLGLFAQRLGAAVDDQEDGGDGHHHGQIVEHIPGQLLVIGSHRPQVVGVDHLIGDPKLLVHPGDHDLLVHRLVGAADEVAVQVHIQIVDVFHRGQGLIDEDVVHIEGVLGQLQSAVPQQLGAVNDAVHQQVLGGAEAADLLPAEHLVAGEHVAVVHDPLALALDVLIDIVAHHHVHQLVVPHELA